MTKKDYELLAEVLHRFHGCEYAKLVEEIAENLSGELIEDNPRFRKDQFMAKVKGEKWTRTRGDSSKHNSWQTGMVQGVSDAR